MPATVRSAAIVGLEVLPVDVEAEVLTGLPSITIVGLPDAAVKEARERITAALQNTGFVPPRHRTIVNLSPTHIRKEGPQFDLPIALAFLLASGQCTASGLHRLVFAGSLALDGELRGITGAVALGEYAAAEMETTLVVPPDNAQEAALAGGRVLASPSLRALVDHLEARAALAPVTVERDAEAASLPDGPDFADIVGQAHAKRALEIAAAGGHNVLLHGPPGAGKTLLARAFPRVLPTLTDAEAFQVTKIYSVRGMLARQRALIRTRPFRSPHHSTSAVALIGGGTVPKPGEVTLAHHGVLFLDEFAEFPRTVLDHLRQPLEDGVVHVSRAAGASRFPAAFSLIAAMNPCPCGFAGDPHRMCTCSPGEIAKYQRRISGPLLDRIDLHVHVPALPPEEILADHAERGEPSAAVRARVLRARDAQAVRFGGSRTNAQMRTEEIKTFCALAPDGRALLVRAADALHLSARAMHRSLKVARTIADVAGADTVAHTHIGEALQYRMPLGVA